MKFIVLILSIFISVSACAEGKPEDIKKSSSAYNTEDIQKIEKYLNDINTLAAPFEQEDSSGAKTTGTFYLARPGRLRWDYDLPTPILIVAKGSLVAYYDKELDEVSHISLDDTMAGILTKQKISFSEDGAKILGLQKKDDEIHITITQNKKEDQGKLTMVFKASNIDLLRMEVVDSIGKTTIVRFKNLVYNKPLEKELFILPRVKTKLR